VLARAPHLSLSLSQCSPSCHIRCRLGHPSPLPPQTPSTTLACTSTPRVIAALEPAQPPWDPPTPPRPATSTTRLALHIGMSASTTPVCTLAPRVTTLGPTDAARPPQPSHLGTHRRLPASITPLPQDPPLRRLSLRPTALDITDPTTSSRCHQPPRATSSGCHQSVA
jgi:hypothetical protein